MLSEGMKSYYARKTYRQAHGSIPKGFDIHHKDRNRDNNSPENLEALSRPEHVKKHRLEGGWGFDRYCEKERQETFRRLESQLYLYNNNLF